MKIPFDRSCLRSALERMDIADIAQATIRQSGDIARIMETQTGMEFLHLEMGVPGLPPETVGVEAEQQALAQGHASIYPSITGIAPLKSEASRFVKAFLDIDVAPEGCIPTVGSMQGGFCLFQISSQCDPKKDTILFIDPGFPVQRQQVRILGIKHESFDIYDFRAEKLGPKLESYLKQGNVAAIIYSNPNNPAWICLTESELRTIGELATKYDTIVLEDLAYMGMDFRKELGHPFQAPFQATAARYTDNYVLMISGSKIFSYAGQRIAIAAISDKLRNRFYPALKERYGIGRFAESYALTFLCTDVIGEIWGKKEANKAVIRGFAAQLIALVLIILTMYLPAYDEEMQRAYRMLLGQTPIFVFGSLVAYLCSQSWDVWIFHKIRGRFCGNPKRRWIWNNASTLTSQIIDTAIYISIAFGIGLGWFMQEGGMMLVLGMVIGQYLLKAGLALCDTPFFYLLTRKHQEV